MKVSKAAYPDDTQFDRKSDYFDPKATRENPRWVNVDVKLVKKTRLVSLDELRAHPELQTMQVLRRGNRLSIMPVTSAEWKFVASLL
jgi:predicted RNA-binding protein with PUA-like domain